MNYDKFLSSKIKTITPSGIRKFFDIANSMKNVISLGVGEPNFSTSEPIIKAGITALSNKNTFYTSNSGSLELRETICDYLKSDFNVNYSAKDEVYITVGASEAIDNAIRALLSNGDDVIIPTPAYVSYEPLCMLVGANVVTIKTQEKDCFKVTAEQIKNAITPKTKLIILSFPSNPTGAILEKKDLEEIAKVIIENDILVISDEIYAELTYEQKHISIASILGMKERTILISGFSKSFAMTGWRIGYACGPKEIIEQMLKIHQFAIMCAPTNGQIGATVALKEHKKEIVKMRESYNERRKFILKAFLDIGFSCFEPKGAFYIFPNITTTKLTSEQFCEQLLFKKHIAVVPGTAFGSSGEGYVRVSYSYSMEHIKIAMCKIKEFVTELENI